MRRASLFAPVCFTLSGACTVKEVGTAPSACNGPDCQDAGIVGPLSDDDTVPPEPTETPTPPRTDAGATPPATDAGRPPLYPVCQGLCALDDSMACADFDPEDELDARALYSDSESRLFTFRALMNAAPDAGVNEVDASASDPAEAGRVTASDDGAEHASEDAGASVGAAPGGEDVSSDGDAAARMGWSCQIDRDEGAVAVGCWLAGTGEDGSPCTSTRDCQAGYACVGDGECRKFCCGGDDACAGLNQDQDKRRYFCDERPLRSPNVEGEQALDVPVCALADMCNLSEPFPCQGNDCTCPPEKACFVVSQKGATGCRVPGDGGLEDPCPCQAGYYCHPVEKTCKQMCNLDRDDGACGESLCQATANWPAGVGLCQPVAPATE